ncbi:taurine catabolism dioxygenase TauD [Metarhizium album ARSEF 1941]|uniref:Taurine catabolism dioxygenase TauD n=1 Tax=Metarhizium album (strain ARSEF 1941) TaxID=1081103 RepID=A0A0B2X190_METAS|nr:taurine catabolism dioxygenase TauD [Metarhizium album ARSEF 1941]KHN99639.1 taurine catabolism dioxygenase TauD [Metarhizium album ARSEF 1941]
MMHHQAVRNVARLALCSRPSLHHEAITSCLGAAGHTGLPSRSLSTTPSSSPSFSVPHLQAPHLLLARQRSHVALVARHLEEQGILKITLGFPDPESTYLERLIVSLHQHHGHRLPISHSASRGWFWDVRPATSSFQTRDHQARSETMADFPWHTDCSYEDPTPRLFALHVLRHDHLGGGTLSVTNVARLASQLSPATRAALGRDEFQVAIPREFVKDPRGAASITGSLLSTHRGRPAMRFRRDILAPQTPSAASALDELSAALERAAARPPPATLHLEPAHLPSGSVILVDNFRWLHARNHVRDPARHLRRVRWDAVPLGRRSERETARGECEA